MKKRLAFLFVFTLLIASLSACGCSASTQNDAPQNDIGTQNQNNTPNDSAIIDGDPATDSAITPDAPASDDAQGSLEQGVDDIRDGIDHAVDDIAGDGLGSGGVSYEQMLRNGRVKNGALAKDGTASN